MGQVLSLPVSLETVDCGECGGSYALNERFINQKREKGGFWHCPYCENSWGYSKEVSAVERARKEAEAAKALAQKERQRAEEMLARANEAQADRDKALRKLKRVSKGTCPCCQRSFVNLKRHMESKHPEGVTS